VGRLVPRKSGGPLDLLQAFLNSQSYQSTVLPRLGVSLSSTTKRPRATTLSSVLLPCLGSNSLLALAHLLLRTASALLQEGTLSVAVLVRLRWRGGVATSGPDSCGQGPYVTALLLRLRSHASVRWSRRESRSNTGLLQAATASSFRGYVPGCTYY
jgi:hypothetical protein